jgi:hypothetical protein
VALIAGPSWTLRQLGLTPVSGEAEIFVRWIGLFVFAVGAAYLAPFAAPEPERSARLRGALAWTAGARLLVVGFIALAVLSSALPEGWCLVGSYDGVVAIVQLALLSRGSFGEVLR